jgi:hypothetical protein
MGQNNELFTKLYRAVTPASQKAAWEALARANPQAAEYLNNQPSNHWLDLEAVKLGLCTFDRVSSQFVESESARLVPAGRADRLHCTALCVPDSVQVLATPSTTSCTGIRNVHMIHHIVYLFSP